MEYKISLFVCFLILLSCQSKKNRPVPSVDVIPIQKLAYSNADIIFHPSGVINAIINPDLVINMNGLQKISTKTACFSHREIMSGIAVYGSINNENTAPFFCKIETSDDGVIWEEIADYKNVELPGKIIGVNLIFPQPIITKFLKISISQNARTSFPVFKIKFLHTNPDAGWGNWVNGKNLPKLFYLDTGFHSKNKFDTIVNNTTAYLHNLALQCVQELYGNEKTVPPHFNNLQIGVKFTKIGNGPAWVSQDKNFPVINIMPQYFNRFDLLTLSQELQAILIHEFVHIYQLPVINNKNQLLIYSKEIIGAREGIADAVRIKAGLCPPEYKKPGGNWIDGYRTTGFFLEWLTIKDTDAIKKFNKSFESIPIDKWSFDAAMKYIFGKKTSIQQLWTEYQSSIPQIKRGMPE